MKDRVRGIRWKGCAVWWVLAQLAVFQAGAQVVEIDTLRGVRPWGAPLEYSFPSVRIVDDPSSSERVNASLRGDFLAMEPGTKDPLEALWGEDTGNGMSRIDLQAWACVRSSAGILTITFSGESCAAHCEGFERHFLYDVRTGMRLDPAQLFNTDGEGAMLELIDTRWRAAVEVFMKTLDGEEGGPAREQLRSCLVERPVGRPTTTDLLVEPDGLLFIQAPCGRAMDRLEDEPRWAVLVYHYEMVDHLLPAVREALDW